jgi:integrase
MISWFCSRVPPRCLCHLAAPRLPPLQRHRPLALGLADRASRSAPLIGAAGLVAGEWTPREMRHSFVSLLSDNGMPLEDIARLVGHSGTSTTESVYRKQIRPVIIEGAGAMDEIFKATDR